MSAAVVRSEQLDVVVMFAAVHLVPDSVVREVHLAIKVREVVLARPVADLVLAAIGSSIAVGAVAVVVLQEFLVPALQVLLEDDAVNLEVSVCISETGFLLAICRVQIRVVVDLAGATDASVERLRLPVVPLQGLVRTGILGF